MHVYKLCIKGNVNTPDKTIHVVARSLENAISRIPIEKGCELVHVDLVVRDVLLPLLPRDL